MLVQREGSHLAFAKRRKGMAKPCRKRGKARGRQGLVLYEERLSLDMKG